MTLCLVLMISLAVPVAAAQPPAEPGEAAFAALAEIAAALRADPSTDWSRVDLLALREHLVDMSEVTLRAAVEESPIEGGVSIRVTGSGRTLEALRRMIPMHTSMMSGGTSWSIASRSLADGYQLDVTSGDATEVQRLRALGFFGFLAAGDHHRRHHLGVASGTMSHSPDHGGHQH